MKLHFGKCRIQSFFGAAPIPRAKSRGRVRLFGSVTQSYSVFFSPQPQNLSAVQKRSHLFLTSPRLSICIWFHPCALCLASLFIVQNFL